MRILFIYYVFIDFVNVVRNESCFNFIQMKAIIIYDFYLG